MNVPVAVDNAMRWHLVWYDGYGGCGLRKVEARSSSSSNSKVGVRWSSSGRSKGRKGVGMEESRGEWVVVGSG